MPWADHHRFHASQPSREACDGPAESPTLPTAAVPAGQMGSGVMRSTTKSGRYRTEREPA